MSTTPQQTQITPQPSQQPTITTTPKPEVQVRISLNLPEKLHDLYAERATKFGRTVEEEVMLRLVKAKDWTSTQPIYFTDSDRAALTNALGHLITTPQELLAQLKNIIKLKVGEVVVPLDERLMVRLGTRVMRGQTMESMLVREVTEALERFTGLR